MYGSEWVDNLLAARLQMAFTLGFHIILACFGVGMPILLLMAEGLYLRTGDTLYRILARRWSRVFAVLFAVGAVSGTVLSFELGLLWPVFMARYGAVISLPFTLEGFAFFLEAVFVGLYLYGWKRLPGWAHWWTGVPIALSGIASAWFVVTANAWMNVPTGFREENGKVVDVDPVAAMLNAATPAQTIHMILAAFMVAGFTIASFYAWQMFRYGVSDYLRRGMTLGLILGCVTAVPQMLAGDYAAKMVARLQPIKLGAMEAHFETQPRAPLNVGGWMEDGRLVGAVQIPMALSILAHGDADAVVAGLNDFPKELWPPVGVVHIAFDMMVGAGTALLGFSLLTAVWWGWKRQVPTHRAYLLAASTTGLLSIVALEAGWVVTEVGRQPWIVHGLLRTADAVTHAPYVGYTLVGAFLIYGILFGGAAVVLGILGRTPLEGHSHDT